MPNVWEYVRSTDHLLEHVLRTNGALTLCGRQPWSPATDPKVDPDGNASEDIWFGDHDRQDAVRPCQACQTIVARRH